jgi:hypothetical protein
MNVNLAKLVMSTDMAAAMLDLPIDRFVDTGKKKKKGKHTASQLAMASHAKRFHTRTTAAYLRCIERLMQVFDSSSWHMGELREEEEGKRFVVDGHFWGSLLLSMNFLTMWRERDALLKKYDEHRGVVKGRRRDSFLCRETWNDLRSMVFGAAVFAMRSFYLPRFKGQKQLCDYLVLRKVTQDDLENLFSVLRNSTGSCRNPSVLECNRFIGGRRQNENIVSQDTGGVKGGNAAATKRRRPRMNPGTILSKRKRQKRY